MRRSAVAAQLVSLGVVVAASFAPWARSGFRHRSSYQLAHLARRLGVIDDERVAVLARGWAAMPAVAALVVLAHVRNRPGWAVLPGLVVSLSTVFLAVAVKSSPLAADQATTVALVAAIICALSSAALGVVTATRVVGGQSR